MQVANRTTRRYVTPSSKTSAGNIRPIAKKQSTTPSVSHSSPKKTVEAPSSNAKEQPTLKKLIDRFRNDEPQPRPERDSISSDFWWLREELQKTCDTVTNDDEDDRESNIPEFIEIFPSTDIDQDLNKRASLLLNQTFSAHSSDIGHVSSTGIGSTASTTMTTTTTSTFRPTVIEKPARPIFTRITDSKFDLKSENGDDDILYQWRLRRRLEQAQNGEPITFPSKITNRTAISPVRPFFPTIPVEIPSILPPTLPPPPISISKPSSPKREREQLSTTNTEPEQIKPPASITPTPIRQCSEVSTQTLQDACIQTSPIKEDHAPSSSNATVNEIDHRPTRDEEQQSSVWHRPPPRSKYELTHASASPSPIKRHHHHHRHHSFRPVVITEQPTVNDVPHHRSIVYPSTTVQSSQDSTLTHVTSIMVNDRNAQNRHDDHHHHLDLIDQSHEQLFHNESADLVDYSNDEILHMLIQKRDELLMTFRDIEQRLTNMNMQ